MSRGRFDDAIAQSEISGGPGARREQSSAGRIGMILCVARRYNEPSGRRGRSFNRRTPKGSANAHLILGIALTGAGHYDEAAGELRTAVMDTAPSMHWRG